MLSGHGENAIGTSLVSGTNRTRFRGPAACNPRSRKRRRFDNGRRDLARRKSRNARPELGPAGGPR